MSSKPPQLTARPVVEVEEVPINIEVGDVSEAVVVECAIQHASVSVSDDDTKNSDESRYSTC